MSREQRCDERIESLTLREERMLLRARAGEADATELVLYLYRPLVERQASRFYLPGAERVDVIQEGMLGLLRAIRDYRGERRSGFAGFARVCVTRQIISALKRSTRLKHLPLNDAASLDQAIDPQGTLLVDVVADPMSLGEIGYWDERSEADRVASLLAGLTPLERICVLLRADGLSQTETAGVIGRRVKAVDNALQRARHKLDGSRRRG